MLAHAVRDRCPSAAPLDGWPHRCISNSVRESVSAMMLPMLPMLHWPESSGDLPNQMPGSTM